MDFKDHFSQAAARYATYRPSYPPALADFLADLAPGHALAWDAGCGSGQLSAVLAGRFRRVVATDASAAQLERAAAHPRVEYRLAPADASGLPDGAADLAAAAQAAHWFDLERYYGEVRRVARAGAVVALVAYGRMRVGPDVDGVIGRFYTDVLGRHWPPERRHVDEGYRSLPFPFAEMVAPALEIRVDWVLAELVGYIGTWSGVRALERAGGGAAHEAFRRRLAAAWGAEDTARTVRWPLALRVGRR